MYIFKYILITAEVFTMNTTTVFKNGNSQAVRIPKDYRFTDDEVAINKLGDIVMLMPKKSR